MVRKKNLVVVVAHLVVVEVLDLAPQLRVLPDLDGDVVHLLRKEWHHRTWKKIVSS